MSWGNCTDQDAVKIIDTPRTQELFDRLTMGFSGSVIPIYPCVFLLPLVGS
jgi:hypothetical protein